MIVPTLCVGMQPVRHSHAERGNDQHRFWVVSAEFAAQVELYKASYFSGVEPGTQQAVQLAECRLTRHAATRKHACTAQPTAGLVNIQLDTTFMALGDGYNDNTFVPRPFQAGEKLRVIAGPGTAALSLIHI